MNKYNTKLGQLLSLVGRPEFDKLVKEKASDKFCKGFSTWQQFVAMTFAQISNQNGLRSISESLNTNAGSLYHLGITKNISRSTLSYANNNRSCDFFEALYFLILSKCDSKTKKKLEKNFFAIDATTIGLNIKDFPWADFRSTKGGIKLHVKYDINNCVPEYLFITNAREHENNTLQSMQLEKDDLVTFDKGYNNYEQFFSFCEMGVQFVTRLKDNAKYEVVSKNECRLDTILEDEVIKFTGKVTQKKCPAKLRRIKSLDEKTGKSIVILTNILDGDQVEIAEIYRKRWQIELFFKTIKQNLRVKKFYGQSENAVKTQIWIALIVYLLFMMLKKISHNTSKRFAHFISELSVCLFQRSSLIDWFNGIPPERYEPPSYNNPNQLEFCL